MTESRVPVEATQTASGVRRSPAHEGLRAGALGATVVWLWFFASDMINGTPLHLTANFGRGLMGFVGATGNGPIWQPVLVFTIAHFVYWCLLAVIVLKLIHAATTNPSVLGLGATVFILFQFLFVGITAILSNSGMGTFAWPSVWLGNIAGWVAAWWLIAHRHPELRDELRHMNDDN
jgi:hypothetical protein